VFAARYEPNSYIVFRKRLVSKRLISFPFPLLNRKLTVILGECARIPVVTRRRLPTQGLRILKVPQWQAASGKWQKLCLLLQALQ
jgi:hypothetical protein